MDNAKILIVDDLDANRVALKKLLAPLQNIDVYEAASGEEALKVILDHDFAIILLDVQMPGLDGFEVAEILGSEESTRDIPIIFITAAYNSDIHRMKGYGVGCIDYIQKPIEKAVLLSKLQVLLELYHKRHDLEQELSLRTKAEADLRQLNETMEEVIESRSKELIETNYRLRLANHKKSTFLASLSHELRTPINAINGFATILSMSKPTDIKEEKYHDYLKSITQSSTYLTQLITDLLDASAYDVGELHLKPSPHNVIENIQYTVQALEPEAVKKGIRLNWTPPKANLEATFDETRFKQCLMNLLQNAIKFNNGNNCIDITLTETDDHFTIAVKDQGIGISNDQIENALELFGRTDDAYVSSHGGVGIGLYLVNAITHLHKGTLDIESTLGEGTCVTLTWPKHPSHGH